MSAGGERELFQEITEFNKKSLVKGIRFSLFEGRTFVVESERQMKALSSAVLGGGWRRARFIINHTVDRNYAGELTPEEYLSRTAKRMNLGRDVLGLMTAVDVRRTMMASGTKNDVAVTTLCTAGVGNACSAGSGNTFFESAGGSGTINLVVLIDGNLTEAAMVNIVITATEAKAIAMMHVDVRLPDGTLATGTTTDSIVVACTERGMLHHYGGLATDLGLLVGRTVYRAVGEAVKNGLAPDEPQGYVKLN